MLIDQQQKPSETSQENVQRFSDLLLKSGGLLQNQAKDLVCTTNFMRNLYYQILHYILGKNPTSVQNTIALVQKKDAELKIIEGLHDHDLGHEIHNIHSSENDISNKLGPCRACNGPHFINNCDERTCIRSKPNLNSHIPSKCPRKHHSN